MNQKGFSAHLLLIITAAVLVVGAVGFYVYHRNKANALYISEYGCHSTATIGQGNTGPCVTAVQYIINGTHCFSQIATDGIFGPITKSHVQQYQSRAGLVADGIVGPNTWGNMLNGTPGRIVNCNPGGK